MKWPNLSIHVQYRNCNIEHINIAKAKYKIKREIHNNVNVIIMISNITCKLKNYNIIIIMNLFDITDNQWM